MSARTVLEDIQEKIAQLTPVEREQVRAWLNGRMAQEDSLEEWLEGPMAEDNASDGEGEEITEEDLREKLKSCEEYYGIPSEGFARRYDARDPEVLKFDHAGGWRSFYSLWEQMRDETSQG
jgi:hypothetical protein